MRALVVYESMYGNTHVVATKIAEGLGDLFAVDVVPVSEADHCPLDQYDLVVCGGPTHVHGMSSERSREAAVAAVEHPKGDKAQRLTLDPDAGDPGLRDWLGALPKVHALAAAAFDTRIDAPAAFTGRASKAIARRLRDHGFRLVVEPESFLVDKETRLVPGEDVRARVWAAELADAVVPALG